ncbi:DUF6221 family protein [Streptomyces sp. NPDC095613]|uniref:DUF6221 family protein n=1 Tax=Streptomyces sp. NPDC095613 TaxID=3155540 RepID=UPI0033306B7D
MSARGEQLLAFLESAITAREKAARAVGYDTIAAGDYLWGTKYLLLRRGDESKASSEMDADLADHLALHDPESVLRRCAADRKLLELHAGRMHSCPAKDETGYLDEWTHFGGAYACPVLELLAEGYGWPGGAL